MRIFYKTSQKNEILQRIAVALSHGHALLDVLASENIALSTYYRWRGRGTLGKRAKRARRLIRARQTELPNFTAGITEATNNLNDRIVNSTAGSSVINELADLFIAKAKEVAIKRIGDMT